MGASSQATSTLLPGFVANGDRSVVSIHFTWLTAAGGDDLTGWEQTVRLPCDALAEFDGPQPGGWRPKAVEGPFPCGKEDAQTGVLLEGRIFMRHSPTKSSEASWYAACGITLTGLPQTRSALQRFLALQFFLPGVSVRLPGDLRRFDPA